MRSPSELKSKLRRHWEHAGLRESRLLGFAGAWPWTLSIGKPNSRRIRDQLDDVKRHLERWRQVHVGKVLWEQVVYRHASQPVGIPVAWQLDKPSEWIEAIGDPRIRAEFRDMGLLVADSPEVFRSLLIRRRSLWSSKESEEVLQATRLAMALQPGCAMGRPLRTLAIEGIDTKFFERNFALLVALLDARFDGEPSRLGLETFLGAPEQADHWLLVVDLDGSLLPFEKVRVKSSDLSTRPMPGQRLLVVENETSQHQLCSLPGTLAVLGAGFDLNWMHAAWLSERQVGYWGDIDTWGLGFLSKARLAVPRLDALLMDADVFESHRHSAVKEPVSAGEQPPAGLRPQELDLYGFLLGQDKRRLEQEFLPTELVHRHLRAWVQGDRRIAKYPSAPAH